MEKDGTGLERTILLATSVVGRLGGLFAAINGLFDSYRRPSAAHRHDRVIRP
jgi:hypothetical protein